MYLARTNFDASEVCFLDLFISSLTLLKRPGGYSEIFCIHSRCYFFFFFLGGGGVGVKILNFGIFFGGGGSENIYLG